MQKKETESESKNKIESLIEISLNKIRSMIDVNCVIGDPVTLPDNSVIIPVSKVTVGFLSGGGEYNDLNSKRNFADYPLAGGTGGGFNVTPIGFFAVKDGKFKIIHADKSSAYLTLLKSASEVLKKMSFPTGDNK